MAVGGDIKELRVNHPTLGSRVFGVKAKESNTYDPGGPRSEDSADAITTQGKPIRSISMTRGEFNCMIENDQATDDAQFIADLSKDPVEGTWQITVINGTEWKLVGSPVGDIKPDIMNATLQIKVQGGPMVKVG